MIKYRAPLSRDNFTAHGHLVSLIALPTGECVWNVAAHAYERRGEMWDVAPTREDAKKAATLSAERSRERYEDWST